MAQIRGVFRKIIINYPPGGQIVAPKHIFTPIFRLHTVTTGSGLRCFCSFLRCFDVLIEIYPLVPFPSSVREGVSDVTADVLRWGPVTLTEAFAPMNETDIFIHTCEWASLGPFTVICPMDTLFTMYTASGEVLERS